jgi:hypothetical protein
MGEICEETAIPPGQRADGSRQRIEEGKSKMKKLCGSVVALGVFLTCGTAVADDLTEATRLLCASVQATECFEDGDCEIDLPWNLNIPDFIEIDLEAKRLSTTEASGLNRATDVEHLSRADGLIILQGFENERAFSFVITEQTGHLSAAIATEGKAVAVFGTCTPIAAGTGPPGN